MVLKGVRAVCLAAVLGTLLTGCMFFTTKREGRQLKLELSSLKKRLTTLRKNEKQLQAALKQARSDQAKLEKVLEQARKVLLRNSADLGAKVQILESQLGKILGRLENLENDLKTASKVKSELVQRLTVVRMQISALKQRVLTLHTRPAEPRGADAVFEYAQKAFQRGAYQLARKYYKKFSNRFPTDRRAAMSLYLIGVSYFKENKFGAADYSFKQMLARFPSVKHAPQAIFYRARCHFELKYCKSALNLLAQLRKRFPKSTQAVQARRMSVRVRRVLRNSRFCGS